MKSIYELSANLPQTVQTLISNKRDYYFSHGLDPATAWYTALVDVAASPAIKTAKDHKTIISMISILEVLK